MHAGFRTSSSNFRNNPAELKSIGPYLILQKNLEPNLGSTSQQLSCCDFIRDSSQLILFDNLTLWRFQYMAQTPPYIAILAIGLAGLTFAYYLKKVGFHSILDELDYRLLIGLDILVNTSHPQALGIKPTIISMRQAIRINPRRLQQHIIGALSNRYFTIKKLTKRHLFPLVTYLELVKNGQGQCSYNILTALIRTQVEQYLILSHNFV